MRSFSTWPAPLPGGETSEEAALIFDQARENRVLVIPALFDEANKLRRLTVEVMHRLDLSGIDSFLPDLPGCNDSLQPLADQTVAGWREATKAAALRFEATHILTIRHGALLAASQLPGWRYAPVPSKKLMRSLMRSRAISAKEAGLSEGLAEIEQNGRAGPIELAGWCFGSSLFSALVDAELPSAETLTDIPQDVVGGAGLWLRAEPDEDPEQADALAALIAIGLDHS